MIKSIIAVTLVLGGLIFFHELGHFLVARLLGIGVRKFSLGFGPKLAAAKSGMTEYRLSLIPLGGYVQLAGESPEDTQADDFPDDKLFNKRPAWQRMMVVAAGPISNFLLAALLYWAIFLSHGQQELLPVIGELQPDSPAMAAGLKPGDTILTVDGENVNYWRELAETIQERGDRPLTFTLKRDGEPLTLTITPENQVRRNIFGEEVSKPMIGIGPDNSTVTIHLGPGEAAGAALLQTWTVVKLTAEGIVKIVERIVPLDTIGGPIMIAKLVSQQASEGLVNVMALAAVISINLGLVNLLPIPVLDGGHIMFYGLETVLRRPLSERWQQATTRMGIAFLLALMALAIYNDILNLSRGMF